MTQCLLTAMMVVMLVKKPLKEPKLEATTGEQSTVYKIINPLNEDINVTMECGTAYDDFIVRVPGRMSQEFVVNTTGENFYGFCHMSSYKKAR